MKKITCYAILFAAMITSYSQINKPSIPPINWQLMDWQKDGYPGISLEKAYNELLKNKKPLKKIIVSIVDCGLDDKHPDLAGMEWTNKKEISGNGIDDDVNGYVDDVHGWNFTGNLTTETFEEMREYVKLRGQFENKTDTLALKVNPKFAYWKKIITAKNKMLDEMEARQKGTTMFLNAVQTLQNYWSKTLMRDTVFIKEVKNKTLDSNADSSVIKAQTFFMMATANETKNIDSTMLILIISKVKENQADNDYVLHAAQTIIERNDAEFFRKEAVGDDANLNIKKNYGNANTTPAEPHGTECAGTIAALRNNNIGGNGISNSVALMTVKITATHSHADERDKDVANAIRYSVDNGAQIISMSFGKLISPQKKWVDEAVKYAEQKGVLLIFGAGNAAANNDTIPFYPIAVYTDKKLATNFIKVGASTYDSTLVANFSNYGIKTVDVYAPGVRIYTTSINNTYEWVYGTSFACPMVAGLAALIWSYYPTFTYRQVKECIEKSATPINILVTKPGTKEKILFSSLSRTGGIVNAYNAVKLADEMSKKTK